MSTVLVLAPDAGGTGSVSGVVRNHVRQLAVEHEVVLVSATVPAVAIPGVRFHPVQAPGFHWLRRFGHVPREMALVQALWREGQRVCRRQRVDALMVHSHALGAWAGRRAQARFRVPFLLVVHGDIHDRPAGTYDARLTAFYRWVTPIAYRHADRVLAISQDVGEAAVRHGADPSRVRVVPNGIAPEEIGLTAAEDTRLALDTLPLRLLYVGRLSVEKGVADLLSACALLARRDVPFMLELVGDGPLRTRLERQAAELGLGERVRFLGPQPRPRLGALYQSVHITCVPSLSEPQGIVVLESLIAGVPVVASDVGGIPDMVRHGENGYLHAPGNPEQIAERIAALATDRDALARMARAARSSVAERFLWTRTGRELRDIISELEAVA